MNDFATNIVYITNVSLRSRYNGHGIASELMKACLKKAKQSKFMKIDLKVLIGNIPAINLYKKFGFKACEKEGNYLKMECHLL
jgi:ribosomal protein S18 acetylase RimI-like enzyme